jgi:hypothetical protein
LEASDLVLSSDEFTELVVHLGTVGVEEGATWSKLMSVEDLLSSTDLSVVTLLGLFFEVNVVGK